MKKKSISNDLKIAIAKEDDIEFFTVIHQKEYRTATSINFGNEEIRELYDFLKEHFEEENDAL